MKKYIALVLTLVCILGLVGFASRSDGATPSEHKRFNFENVSKLIVISVDGKRYEITDTDTVRKITENIESIQFEKGESSENTNGFGPFIQWYDANDNLIESISVMAEETILYDGFFWTAIDGNIDYTAINQILGNVNQDTEKIRTDTDGPSSLDGVTMEVTEYSDTSITVRITNDTDMNIECGGEDFCLKILDEETGEWRDLDTVIDDYGFFEEAYMIQKDSPLEMVINFEWLYGKLEPGRYQIVKTVTDFRGTGDYTDYVLAAEFDILMEEAEYSGAGDCQIVMNHIHNIGEKIEDDPAQPAYIQTVWGVGYRFCGENISNGLEHG